MRRMGAPFTNVFARDSAKPCQKVIEAAHNPGKFFTGITERTPEEEEDTDVYAWTPPRQGLSQNCLRQGVNGPKQTGQLTKKAMQYIKNKKRRVSIFENVFTLTHKRLKPVLDGIIKGLISIGYTVNYSVLDSRDYGIPQNRRRVFVVAIRSASTSGRHPRSTPILVDIVASPEFAAYGIDEAKTIARSRGGDGGPWIFTRGRRTTPTELIKLQGFELTDIPWTTLKISQRQLGQLIGTAVSVNTIGAILEEALWSSGLVEKKDEHTDKAKAWLAWVDSERCLMFAMMADVADEGMCLTRLLDNEDVGTACLNSEVLLFIGKVVSMFGESERCLTIFGYTSVMMNLLNEYVVWHVNDDSRSIGFERGAPVDIVNRCMERMRSYVVLARAALAAEFPSFEMSQAADINPTRLQVQWEHGCPRARQQQQRGLSKKEAWRYVIQKLGQQRLALRRDIDDLRSALVAYVAFGISTSGVEQKFSLAALKFNCRQLSSDACSEDRFLNIALDLPNRDLNKVNDGVIHAIRCEANVKMRTLAEAARILIDDDTFQHHVHKDFSDLTLIAAQCPGADGRSDMLIMLTEEIERTQQMWRAAEWEFTTGLKKEMKAKWDELHGKRQGEFSEKFDQGEFRRAVRPGPTIAAATNRMAADDGGANIIYTLAMAILVGGAVQSAIAIWLWEREPGGPTPSDEDAAQAMKIHREVDKAHAMAKDTVSHMSGIGAMAKMMGQMLTARRKMLFITKNVLLGYGDLRYAAPLRILPPSAYRLRARLIRGPAAQMDHIAAMLIQIKLLQRIAEDPGDAADSALGPWADDADADAPCASEAVVHSLQDVDGGGDRTWSCSRATGPCSGGGRGIPIAGRDGARRVHRGRRGRGRAAAVCSASAEGAELAPPPPALGVWPSGATLRGGGLAQAFEVRGIEGIVEITFQERVEHSRRKFAAGLDESSQAAPSPGLAGIGSPLRARRAGFSRTRLVGAPVGPLVGAPVGASCACAAQSSLANAASPTCGGSLWSSYRSQVLLLPTGQTFRIAVLVMGMPGRWVAVASGAQVDRELRRWLVGGSSAWSVRLGTTTLTAEGTSLRPVQLAERLQLAGSINYLKVSTKTLAAASRVLVGALVGAAASPPLRAEARGVSLRIGPRPCPGAAWAGPEAQRAAPRLGGSRDELSGALGAAEVLCGFEPRSPNRIASNV
ncbi:unnamed protein product [Prorocentrum cordatum]|uniref:DNA (cytosine-5-)-methyltransferase n=1 Tax=Prorocentrum cordatum TaxID=2364126 RepID=A0ABN9UXL0_9DINO|nr:unnamed protein product [Polarella glacialis]